MSGRQIIPGVGLRHSMDERTLRARLREASEAAVLFARRYVQQTLCLPVAFALVPNASYDGNPLVRDETVFPRESLPDGQYLGPASEEQVVSFLYRNGKVPEWVDVSVVFETQTNTIVELLCCGRFTANHDLLYHSHEGRPPFHVLGPGLPPGWEPDGQKFDLHWLRSRPIWRAAV